MIHKKMKQLKSFHLFHYPTIIANISLKYLLIIIIKLSLLVIVSICDVLIALKNY